MKHYIYFKGHEVLQGFFGSCVNNREWYEGLTVVADFTYERLQKGEVDARFGGGNNPIVFGKDYTLFNKYIVDVEWHDMTPSEKRKYNKVLKDSNLCFKTHKLVGKTIFGKEYTRECEVLCWADTDKMPISVNGEIMTYAEFKKMTFGDNMNVVNSWDNGYSHWGSETNKMESVYRLLNNICADWTEDANDNINTTWRGGKVHCGELWTWKFDKHGVLELRLTEKEFHHSVVSNT